MWILGAKSRIGVVVVLFVWVIVLGLYGLMKPVPNGCGTSYMSYPTYISIPDVSNSTSSMYELFLYHEGSERIDLDEHLRNLDGFPVLFIHGNGGSYKQVRSLAAESSRAYRRGPLEPTFYQEATLDLDEVENKLLEDMNYSSNGQYTHKINWFAVDLKGEQSAMDGRIIEDQSSYVVHAIHRILDQYHWSYEFRLSRGARVLGSPPTNVILVGHSMGGFVARTAVIHPQLRKSAVETIFTFSSPHQYPPIAVQPSLAHFFSEVNSKWRKGYGAETSDTGHFISGLDLSHVVVVSIFGGVYDYQVRSKLSTLAGIVPSSNSITVGSSGIKNVLLSMEHQSILWCNQLTVQVSHTLLGMIDPDTGQPYSSSKKRVCIVRKMLQSRVPESLTWAKKMQLSRTRSFTIKDAVEVSDSLHQDSFSCPPAVNWSNNDFIKDLYIETPSFIILSMDGRRRWLDIKELGSNGKGHFIFLTNLAPCSGVRIHLWPEKHNSSSDSRVNFNKRITDVTRKMVQISVAGPVLGQVKPGSQNAPASPYALLQLNPEEMFGFRFLTIAVARHLAVSAGSPPAAATAVGQFFNPDEGAKTFSSSMLFHMSYGKEEMFLKEEHPLALNLSFAVSLGMLPLALKLRTDGCRAKATMEQTKDIEQRNCKLRCFSPFAMAWDSTFGLHVISNIYDETLTVESSPAMSDSGPASNKTNVMLLVDPRCSYKISLTFSLPAAGSRFLLFYSSQIAGFVIAAAFFALMRQARALELESPLPSVLSSIELNLRIPLPLMFLSLLPILFVLLFKLLTAQELPPAASFLSLSFLCYLIANGALVVLIFCSQILLYVAATAHIFVRKCWLSWKDIFLRHAFFNQILSLSSVFISWTPHQGSRHIVIALVAILLACFVHPALGLTLLLVSHILQSHAALASFLTASSRSHAATIELSEPRISFRSSLVSESLKKNGFDHLPHVDNCSFPDPKSARSFAESQAELFNYWHGLLILHLLSTVMFGPSLFAWMQRLQSGHSFAPWFIDSALSVAIILHGLCAWTSDISSIPSSLEFIPGYEVGISVAYLLAGFYTCIAALFSAPYMALYAMAAIGIVTLLSKIPYLRNKGRGERSYRNNPRHYHKQYSMKKM